MLLFTTSINCWRICFWGASLRITPPHPIFNSLKEENFNSLKEDIFNSLKEEDTGIWLWLRLLPLSVSFPTSAPPSPPTVFVSLAMEIFFCPITLLDHHMTCTVCFSFIRISEFIVKKHSMLKVRYEIVILVRSALMMDLKIDHFDMVSRPMLKHNWKPQRVFLLVIMDGVGTNHRRQLLFPSSTYTHTRSSCSNLYIFCPYNFARFVCEFDPNII